jgi:shikimate dehydrogenase
VNTLYGLIGSKLGHSLSKEIHRRIFEHLEIDAYYHLLEVEASNLHKVLFALNIVGTKGVNVTIPYKCEIMKYLDKVSEEAKNIGAINTVEFKNGVTTGYNTDYLGFGKMMNKFKVDVKNKNVVILGSGGAADAVLQYFIDNNSQEIYIISRNLYESKLKYKSKDVIISNYIDLQKIKKKDIIINCTPCGMYPNVNESPLDCAADIFKNYNTAIDLIYNPMETQFLKDARKSNLQTINGLYMLVAQAFAAQEIWQDRKLDTCIIDEIYEEMKRKSEL